MHQGICLQDEKIMPNIDWDSSIFDYKINLSKIDSNSHKIPLPYHTKHALQFSTEKRKAIEYIELATIKADKNVKHLLILNETITADYGKSLLPRWGDTEKVKAYVGRIREANPGVKLWISNHRLINPLVDRNKKRKTLIDTAKELGLDGVGLQVWLDWKMLWVPGRFLESILPRQTIFNIFGTDKPKKAHINALDKNINILPEEVKTTLINFFSSGLISYIREFGEDVKANKLLFSVPEWAVFLEDQERQYYVTKKLLDIFNELAEFNCYWYLTDIHKPHPGKTGTPGLFDKDLKPKKISTLFLK